MDLYQSLYDFIAEARNYGMVFWLLLPVYSGSLKTFDYPKQICLAHPLSFECFTALKGTHFYMFIWSGIAVVWGVSKMTIRFLSKCGNVACHRVRGIKRMTANIFDINNLLT